MLVGVSTGAAILSKWLPALIVLPVWLLLVWDAGRFKWKQVIVQGVILMATIVAIALPWQLYILREFPEAAAWEFSYNTRHFTEAIEGKGGPLYYHLTKIRINYGELIYLPLAWFLWKTFKNPKDNKRLAVSLWFLIPFLFFSFAKTKMQGYLLFTAPALFIMTGEFFFMLIEYRKGFRHKWLITLALFLLIALPVRYNIERIKPFENRDRNPEWVAALKKLNEENIEDGVLLNYDHPIEAMFYTNLTAYSGIPTKEQIEGLIEQGYTVIINDEGIPDWLESMKGIVLRKFTSANIQ